ncbi:MAG: DUF2461 domain-containing protein [Chloroflexota bacterium]
MSQTPTMTAFSQEALTFLHDLRENNNREWFNANKKRFKDELQAPSVELVATLGTRLQEHFPEITYDVAINGSGSLMRIYRDTRFSKDKTPYKENIAMGFSAGAKSKMAKPSFGIQIGAESAGVMAGQFGFDKEQLKTYRDAVSDTTQGNAMLEAIQAVQSAGNYVIKGAHYKRIPRGYNALDDERDPYLLYNGLWASYETIPADVVTSDVFVDTVIEHFVAMSPIQQWLQEIFS